jgi:hypothetical protein
MQELPCPAAGRRFDGIMRPLNYDFRALCRRHPHGDAATRTDRERVLHLVAYQLHQMGFEDLRAEDLEPEHVSELVMRWLGEGLVVGTLKNRLTTLRWLAREGTPARKGKLAPSEAASRVKRYLAEHYAASVRFTQWLGRMSFLSYLYGETTCDEGAERTQEPGPCHRVAIM